MMDALNAQYDDILMGRYIPTVPVWRQKNDREWRLEVYRDYRLHIDFNIDFEHFSNRRIRKARFKREVGIKQKLAFFKVSIY